MFITKLDVINDCLKTMGETKLNTLEDDHVYKDDALDQLDRTLRDVSALRLWFNTEALDLQPQPPSGNVMLPTDVISVNAGTRCGRYRVAQRGRRLYDVGRNTYAFTTDVKVVVGRLLDFDLCPYEVQQFVRDDTVLRFQQDFDGDNGKYQKILRKRDESWILLKSEHIRQVKANPLYARTNVRILAARYGQLGMGHPWHWQITYPAS